MSDITSIYSAVAAMTVSVGSITPRVRNINQLRTAVNSADAPVRLLLVTDAGTEARDFGFIALGKLANLNWVITDRLLWKPASQGAGISECSAELVSYMAAYVEAIRTNRKTSNQSHIVSASFKPGIYYWPDNESGTPYYGVDVRLTIEEVLSS